METIVVTPGGSPERAYSVLVGSELLANTEWAKALNATQAFIIADKRLDKVALSLTKSLKAAGWKVAKALLSVSEGAKDYKKIFPVYTTLIEEKMDRNAVIFALGGGVIGDLSGFIAGTYLRGIRWVGIPSTLLAQVDSSVGGKTGVNHSLGKNLIGVFHQPSLVVCDIDLLNTLSQRDRVSGFAEMLKCALTYDSNSYDFLVQNAQRILKLESAPLTKSIFETVGQKASVVQRDEYERRGLRQFLNFGHTMGHVLETATEYKRFRHGEAVLWGMRLEMAISTIRGHLPETVRQLVDGDLSKLPVPTLPKISPKSLLSLLKRDKKVKDGKVNFILLEAIGKAVADDQVTDAEVLQAWKQVSSLGSGR